MFKFLIFILIFNTFCFALHYQSIEKKLFHHHHHNADKRDTGREGIRDDEQHTKIGDQQTVKKELGNMNAIELNESTNVTTKPVVLSPVANTNVTTDTSTDFLAPGLNVIRNLKDKFDGHTNNTLIQGFYIFLGFSVIVLIYFVVKSCRLRSGTSAPSVVRKYGVVGRRSDMEMLPLPLTEEEDDDTLFDMGAQINR